MEPTKIDWQEFLACERGLLIAPAGHGKTTAIAECLNLCAENTCQLVLTHTHAGIASLKKKFNEYKVPSSKYQLETITGFAQRYVLAFCGANALPRPEEKEYFNTAVSQCINIINSPVVQNIISISFDGIFVDEYQDCTISQHNLIMAIAQNLPLHILGDPLQGIFDFEHERLVDFDTDLSGIWGFKIFKLLSYPWRWAKTNKGLGEEILRCRDILGGDSTSIKLPNKPESGIYLEEWTGSYDSHSPEFIKWLSRTIHKYESQSTLIICPSYYEENNHGVIVLRGDLNDRMKIRNIFDYSNSYSLLDAVDGKSYYSVSKDIDLYISRCARGSRIDPIKHLYEILASLYVQKKFLSQWISKAERRWKFKDKRDVNGQKTSELISQIFTEFKANPSLSSFLNILSLMRQIKGYSNHRPDFWGEIIQCIKIAISDGDSLYNAMEKHRTKIRHIGRKIEGKCIGTTLLTKGLEFDTVILLNAEKFQDKKHFYVAISRACKQLVILTHRNHITFKL